MLVNEENHNVLSLPFVQRFAFILHGAEAMTLPDDAAPSSTDRSSEVLSCCGHVAIVRFLNPRRIAELLHAGGPVPTRHEASLQEGHESQTASLAWSAPSNKS